MFLEIYLGMNRPPKTLQYLTQLKIAIQSQAMKQLIDWESNTPVYEI